MTKPPKLTKSRHNKELGASRKSQLPEVGAKVLYSVPFPLVAHVKLDPDSGENVEEWISLPEGADPGERNSDFDELPWSEIAVPTGDEEWHLAEVISTEGIKNTIDPNDYLAYIQPLDRETEEPFGPAITVSSVFLREPEEVE